MATAEARYRALQPDRDNYLSRARSSSRLTVPYLIPSSNEPVRESNETFVLPWNGIGARGVHNLASRLLLALLPPTESFFRFTVDEVAMQRQEMQMARQGMSEDQIAQQKSEIELALNRLELSVLRSIETSNDRVAVHEALVHLIVAGNCLLYVSEEGLKCFHLNRYTLLRDPMGNPVEAVVCEEISYEALPDSIRKVMEEEDQELKGIIDGEVPIPRYDKAVRIYTHIVWEGKKVRWHQELKGKELEGTHGTASAEASPWLPLRMIRVDGSSYGPGYVESACIADLQTAEALSQAMAEGALVSAQVKHLVKPSGVTNAKQLAEAPNGAYLPGNPDDVFTIQTQKGGDLNVAMSALQRIEARLAQAFMLADMRDAERVTAEEVRLQALQLENSLGSIYAVLTVEFQSKYIARKLELFTRQGGMAQLPEGLVKPMVSVGLAAVGRGNDLEKTARFMQILQQTIGPEGLAQYVIPTELIRRLASSMGISPLGLVKTEQQLAAEAQQAQQQAMAQQAMAAGMADPQKLANAAATTQEMAMAQQQPTDQPPEQPTA
jgi:hypothetical protein